MLNAVDLRRATVAGSSRKTILKKLVIPSVKFVTSERTPGGGTMTVNYAQKRVQAMEPRFSVDGIDIDAFAGMGEIEQWTMAGAYTDKRTGRVVPGRLFLTGAITSFEPDESDPVEFQGCAYGFSEVISIEFLLDNKQLFKVDDDELVVGGKDLNASVRAALGA
jgi:hypothetical protein